MIIVGVDPGTKGGVTILDTYSYRTTQCLSLTNNNITNIFLFLSQIRGGEPDRICQQNHRAERSEPLVNSLNRIVSPLPKKQVLEEEEVRDNTMEMWLEEPGQLIVNNSQGDYNVERKLLAGLNSSRKLGRSLGLWEGIALALNISIILVPPKKWQKAFGCQTKGDKNVSKRKAKKLFPFLPNITHDVADSLIIAAYGYIHYVSREYTPKVVKAEANREILNEIQNHTPIKGRKPVPVWVRKKYSKKSSKVATSKSKTHSKKGDASAPISKKRAPKRVRPTIVRGQ